MALAHTLSTHYIHSPVMGSMLNGDVSHVVLEIENLMSGSMTLL